MVARKAGVEAEEIVNARDLEGFRSYLEEKQ